MHGDAAGATAGEKVLAVTWGGVAVPRPTLDSRLLFTCVRDAEIVPGSTLRKVYRVLAWSFQAPGRAGEYCAGLRRGRGGAGEARLAASRRAAGWQLEVCGGAALRLWRLGYGRTSTRKGSLCGAGGLRWRGRR